jgi:hypothetical protein
MCVNGNKFTQINREAVQAMQLQFIDYIKDLQRVKEQKIPIAPVHVEKENYVDITSHGYPLLPEQSLADMQKTKLESILRDYLSHHYSA